jgi:SAM-dependent methyltransferase
MPEALNRPEVDNIRARALRPRAWSRPESVRTPLLRPRFITRGGRLTLFFLVLLAGISIVGTSLIRIQNLIPDSQGDVTWSQLKSALFLSGSTSLHIMYLLIVVQASVLQGIRFPRTLPEFAKRYLTIFLCLAYATPLIVYVAGLLYLKAVGDPVGASLELFGPFSRPTKIISLVFFFFVYLLWLYCERVELRHARLDKRLDKQHILRPKQIWTAIETVCLLVIGGSFIWVLFEVRHECYESNRAKCLWFFERWDPFNHKALLIEPKDLFIGLCLAYFLFLKIGRGDSSPETEIYTNWYRDYVSATRIVRVDTFLPPNVTADIRVELGQGSILDFGCGDGERLRQLIIFLLGGKTDIKKLRITGVDRNGYWDDKFVFGPEKFEVSVPEHPAQFDVIHLSHVLYETSTTAAAIDVILQRARPGTLVCVRGASANSPTYLLSVALGSNMLNYHPHHHWKPLHLEKLVRECGLLPVIRLSQGHSKHPIEGRPPDIVFRQTINIENEGTLSSVLGAIFPDSREFSKEVLSALRAAKVKRISMDDELYLFRVPGDRSKHTMKNKKGANG